MLRWECLTHLNEALSRREDAQAQRKKYPTSVEAAAIPILLKLLTNLTIDLISKKQKPNMYKCVFTKLNACNFLGFVEHFKGENGNKNLACFILSF